MSKLFFSITYPDHNWHHSFCVFGQHFCLNKIIENKIGLRFAGILLISKIRIKPIQHIRLSGSQLSDGINADTTRLVLSNIGDLKPI